MDIPVRDPKDETIILSIYDSRTESANCTVQLEPTVPYRDSRDRFGDHTPLAVEVWDFLAARTCTVGILW
jgi:hypothetical protein